MNVLAFISQTPRRTRFFILWRENRQLSYLRIEISHQHTQNTRSPQYRRPWHASSFSLLIINGENSNKRSRSVCFCLSFHFLPLSHSKSFERIRGKKASKQPQREISSELARAECSPTQRCCTSLKISVALFSSSHNVNFEMMKFLGNWISSFSFDVSISSSFYSAFLCFGFWFGDRSEKSW